MKAVFNSGKNNRFPSKLTIGKSYDVISEARPDDAYTYYLVLCDDVEKEIYWETNLYQPKHREQMLNKILSEVSLYR
jgi:hypothetical protein